MSIKLIYAGIVMLLLTGQSRVLGETAAIKDQPEKNVLIFMVLLFFMNAPQPT